MTTLSPTQPTQQPYGELTGLTTLKIQRTLPGPIERVWAYLTESDLRRQWLASGDMTLQADTRCELVWRNDELTQPPGARPDGFSAQHSMEVRIIEADPPHKLVFTWGVNGQVSIELDAQGDEVLFTLVHLRLPDDREIRLKVSAGWHSHLDVLVARVSGTEPVAFWDGWRRLHEEYAQRIPV